MSDYYTRKILLGMVVVTGTLLSTSVTSVGAIDQTHHLLDSQGNPVGTSRPEECVETPKTPNTPSKKFKRCGDVIDRDGDGIDDDEDVCPDNSPEEIVNGVFQRGPQKGCPADSDNDSVPDYRDDCPQNTPLEVSRGVDSRGCPLDSDQDGVHDYRDLCPDTPFGKPVDGQGCAYKDKVVIPPAIKTDVLPADILFRFDSADLTYEGQSVLDGYLNNADGAGIIKQVQIVGHTDSVGTEEYNQELSENRAASVANYLIEQGVSSDQITQWGEGELNPAASNDTSEGRAQNRRVVITITRIGQ